MALFKIFKGSAANLGAVGNPTEVAQEGFAYFTPDNGKFYIDIRNGDKAIIGDNRIPINAYLADKFSSDKTITLTGDVLGTDTEDGETGWTIATSLKNSGVNNGLYGPNNSQIVNGVIAIPKLSINEKGIITSAESIEINLASIDTKVTQQNFTQNSDLRIILSNSATENEETSIVNKSNNLIYNPGTNILSTGNLVLSDDLSVGGDVDITGTLDVTSDTTFAKIPTAPTATAGSNDTKLATTAFVASALSGLIGPMKFIGTLGTGGTATALASASANNKGYTYKVITAGTYQGAAVKVGDLVISNGSSWVVVPSGDEPSGTVTNISIGEGLTGATNPIVSTGDIKHAVPSGANAATLGSSTNRYYIKTITTDKFGHVTGVTTGNETVTNSDIKVKQTAKTDDVNYKILTTTSASPTSGTAAEAAYDVDITLNPSTNTITAANFDGVASKATAANISSTDNAIVRFDGTAGKFQNSKALVDDNGGITLGGSYLTIKPYSSTYDTTGSHAGIRFYFNHDRSGYNADTLITNYSLQATNFYGALKGNADTATTAAKLSNTSKIGDTNHPVYFTASGIPAAVTLASTANNLLSSLPSWTANPTDTTVLIRKDTGGTDSFGQVTFATVWEYIQNKIISEGTNYSNYLNPATSENQNTIFYIHTDIQLTASNSRIAGELLGTGSSYLSGILSFSIYAKNNGFGTCYYEDFYNKLNTNIIAYIDNNNYLHIAINPKTTVYTQWYLNCFVDKSSKNRIISIDQTAPDTIAYSKELIKLSKSITYTPAGINAKSEVTITPITTNIYSMTSAGSVTAGTVPSLAMTVDESTETLSFSWSAGTPTAVTLPGRSSAIAAWTGYTTGIDNTYAAAQNFTGTQATITI